MLSEKRRRRWKGPFLSVLLFVALDFAAGTLIYRFAPSAIDNRLYRRLSPTYHHDLKPNTAAWAAWGPYRYRIYTNSMGFKDACVRDVPLAGEGRRVLLLGDSFTEGLGYAYEDTFAGILQARLAPRGIEVLNAAVSSYSPVIYYRKSKYLIEEVKLHVDEVIVFLDISDIQDEALIYTLSEDGRVVDQPAKSGKSFDAIKLFWSPLTKVDRLKSLLRQHSLTVAIVDRLRERLRVRQASPLVGNETAPLGPWQKVIENERANWTHDACVFAAYGERGIERANRSMELLSDLLRKHGISLTVVVYPWPNQIAVGDLDSKQVRYWRDWTAAHQSRFVDLFGEFINGDDPAVAIKKYYIKGDMHFNAVGHQRVAEAMFEKLPWTAGH